MEVAADSVRAQAHSRPTPWAPGPLQRPQEPLLPRHAQLLRAVQVWVTRVRGLHHPSHISNMLPAHPAACHVGAGGQCIADPQDLSHTGQLWEMDEPTQHTQACAMLKRAGLGASR